VAPALALRTPGPSKKICTGQEGNGNEWVAASVLWTLTPFCGPALRIKIPGPDSRSCKSQLAVAGLQWGLEAQLLFSASISLLRHFMR
jgi:hypothetical protein